jgi:hypothetical protein
MEKYEKIIIKDLRKRSINMLKDIKESLDKFNIKYWLDFGTLLGSIRNGEAIPWDGDFDLSTDDEQIADYDDLWKELDEKGYHIDILDNNIKILQKGWTYGQYRIDLHRYRSKGNTIVYEYGFTYKNRILNVINGIRSLFQISLPREANIFSTYGIICRALLNSGVSPEELYSGKEILIRQGDLNSHHHSTILLDGKEIKIHPMDKASIKSKKRFAFIIKLSIVSRQKIFKLIDRFLKNRKSIPKMTVAHDKKYFTDLKDVDFCGINMKTPNDPELFLEKIYGKNWRVPRSLWEFSTHSPMKEKNGQ